MNVVFARISTGQSFENQPAHQTSLNFSPDRIAARFEAPQDIVERLLIGQLDSYFGRGYVLQQQQSHL